MVIDDPERVLGKELCIVLIYQVHLGKRKENEEKSLFDKRTLIFY